MAKTTLCGLKRAVQWVLLVVCCIALLPASQAYGQSDTSNVSLPEQEQEMGEEQLQEEEAEQRQAEIERRRQIELEQRRQAEIEREQQAEIERQRRAEIERLRQAEGDQQRQADVERQRQAEAERQRQAEAERQRQAEAERQRQAEAERQRQAELDQGRQDEPGLETPPDSAEQQDPELAPSFVSLVASSRSIAAGGRVDFSVTITPSVRAVEYRFDFGDGNTSDWSPTSKAYHVYDVPGFYDAIVEARTPQLSPRLLPSATVSVEVVAVPIPRPVGSALRSWAPLLGALLLLLAASLFLLRRKPKQPKKATAGEARTVAAGEATLSLEPHRDPGKSNIAPAHAPRILLEVRLRAVKDAGRSSLGATGNLITKEQRSHAE